MSKFVTFTDRDQYNKEIFYAIDLEEIFMIEDHYIFFKNSGDHIYVYNDKLIKKHIMPYIELNTFKPETAYNKL